jgi:hypothetical protein
MKSLYDVLETNNDWFVIYHTHHVNKLELIQFIDDSCLFHTNLKESEIADNFQIDLKDNA